MQRSFLGQVMTSRPCPQCGGFGTIIPHPCTDCSGDGRVRTRRTLTVRVPAGVDTGTRIQLAGEGEVGAGNGPAGDLYVEILERPHAIFQRRGDDLHCTLALPMTAAALGALDPARDPRRHRADRRTTGHPGRSGHPAHRTRRHPPARSRARRPARAHRRADADQARRPSGGAPPRARPTPRRGAPRGGVRRRRPGPVLPPARTPSTAADLSQPTVKVLVSHSTRVPSLPFSL